MLVTLFKKKLEIDGGRAMAHKDFINMLNCVSDMLSQSDNSYVRELGMSIEAELACGIDHDKIASILGSTYSKIDGPVHGAAGRANITNVYRKKINEKARRKRK